MIKLYFLFGIDCLKLIFRFSRFPIHGKEEDISYPCMAYPSNAILLDYDSLLSYWEGQFSLREFVSKSQTISSIN